MPGRGSGLSSTEWTTVKRAMVAPMPSAMTSTTMREKPGVRESADSLAKFAEKRFHLVPTPGLARLLAQERGISERAPRGVARFFGRHSGRDVFRCLTLDMEFQFGIKPLGLAAPAEKHLQPHPNFFEEAHSQSQAVSTTRLTASDKRFQLAVSAPSCLRPAAVSE